MWADEVASRLAAATGDDWLSAPDGAVRCWAGTTVVEARRDSVRVADDSVVGDDPRDTAVRALVAAVLAERSPRVLAVLARLVVAGGAR